MAKDWKERSGVVFSTNPEFGYEKSEDETKDTLPPQKQDLRVRLDTKKRKGKVVTLINGFVGTEDDLEALCKLLKTKCGTGGTAKEGEILIQGDFCQKIIEFLVSQKYKVKKSGG
jgi:translation initiation factor 1